MKSARKKKFQMRAKVWLYQGMAGWHFVTLPKKDGAFIRKNFVLHERGWGSHRVQIQLGRTRWKTSIFPDKESGSYVLPLKAEVRQKEGIQKNQTVAFDLELI